MVKLDLTLLRYLSRNDFRVLIAVEMGMKNHDLVPTQLINSLAHVKRGDTSLAIKTLHIAKLIYHEAKIYDGYRLTYRGYDFLSMRTHTKRGNIASIGTRIGTGKESDVFLAKTPEDITVIAKIHRLGRTCFRTIKRNRDYHRGRTHATWLYLSRLAALKEFAYMKALYDNGFPVPKPIDVNRHIILMEYLEKSTLLCHLHDLRNPGRVYSNLMNLLVSLAECGLIHGDFNEFNLMIDEQENITLIDFPQVVSIDHLNAEMYFDRDVDGIRRFFKRKFGFHGAEYPVLRKDTNRKFDLDREIEASGFTKTLNKEFEEIKSEILDDNENEYDQESDESFSLDHDILEPQDLENQIKHLDINIKKLKTNNSILEKPVDDQSPLGMRDDQLQHVSSFTNSRENDMSPSFELLLSLSHPSNPQLEHSHNEPPSLEVSDYVDETRKERRDRLRKLQLERELQEKEAMQSRQISPSLKSNGENELESLNDHDDQINGGLDQDKPDDNEIGLNPTRDQVIHYRVTCQLNKKRLQEKTRIRNKFKTSVKKKLKKELQGWQEDLN